MPDKKPKEDKKTHCVGCLALLTASQIIHDNGKQYCAFCDAELSPHKTGGKKRD